MFLQNYTAVWRQSLVALAANFLSFNIGIAIGWTSPNNPKLEDPFMNDTPLDRIPTREEMSWIGPLVPLGAVISPFLAAPLTRKFGRKYVILGTAGFYIASYVVLGFGETLDLIYIARILQGFGVGFNMCVVPIYVGEIAQNNFRGTLGTLLDLFFVSGIVIAFSIGPFVPYVTFQFICIVLPVMFVALFMFMPESPFFTLMKGDIDGTMKILRYLRGNVPDERIMEEMQEIQNFIYADEKGKWSDLFTNKRNLRALIICTGIMWIQQFSGINAVLMYSQQIFQKGGGSIPPEISSIIMSVVQLMANCSSTLVVERFGRKLILLISNVGLTISMGFLGLYFYFESEQLDIVDSLSFMPITSLIIYIYLFSLGFGPVPWTLLGEMFSADVKNTAAMIVSSACWAFAFLVTKFFDTLNDAAGTHWVFWMFTICLVIGCGFTYLYTIETKGLTLQQIQDRLDGKNEPVK